MFDRDPQLLLGPFGAVDAETTCCFTDDESRSSTRAAALSSVVCAFKVSLSVSVVVLSSGKWCSFVKKITPKAKLSLMRLKHMFSTLKNAQNQTNQPYQVVFSALRSVLGVPFILVWMYRQVVTM